MWFLLSAAVAASWPELNPPPAVADGTHDAAVIVAVDDYAFVSDVPGARVNGEDWFRYLTKTRGLSPAKVHLLRDLEGTREKVLSAVEQAVGEAGREGTVWFVFIGHGAPTPDGRDGVLVGADAQADPDSLYARSLPRSTVLKALGDGGHAHSVAILDTCFSGKAGRGSLMPGLQFMVPTYAMQGAAVTVLTAGTATQFAGPLPGAGRPAFSYLVLGGLTGWADADGNGHITAREAVAYANEAISATVRGRQQTPELDAPNPDRVLATASRSTAPDLVELALDATTAPVRSAPAGVDVMEMDARRAAMEAERLADAREAARVAELAEEARSALRKAAESLQTQATAAWRPLSKADGSARGQVEAFVTTYSGARVRHEGESQGVSIPEVDEALTWLAALSARPVSAPDLSDAALASEMWLWQPSFTPWKRAVGEKPATIWDPYRWIHGHRVFVMRQRMMPDADAALSALAVDAAAYGETWWTADADTRRGLEHALVGALLEARDVSTEARGGRFHVDHYAEDGKVGDAFFYTNWHTRQSLRWMVEEVLLRAEDRTTCTKELAKVEKLAESVDAWLSEVDAHPDWAVLDNPDGPLLDGWEDTWLGYGNKLLKLGVAVHKCSAT